METQTRRTILAGLTRLGGPEKPRTGAAAGEGGHRSRAGRMLRFLLITSLSSALAGCYPGSDAEYAARQAKERSDAATRNRRLATEQTVRGKAVTDDALRRLVSERTWISEYETFPGGTPGRYLTYDYFRQDGQFIWAHNWHYADGKAVPGDRWRVDGARLCVIHQYFSRDEKCYTLALDASGVIQVYIDAPGTPNHGLLTRRIRNTAEGPPMVTAEKGK